MRPFLLLCILVSTLQLGISQNFQEISIGPGYNQQSFIRLLDGTQRQVSNNSWDIAFTAFGFQDAGIFINESAGSSMGQNLPVTELLYTSSEDFDAPVDLEAIKEKKLLNSEKSWLYGAFNELRDTLKPFDYGWGSYVPGANKVVGSKVFVIKLRSGEYRKMKIDVLNGTTYTFRYARLDGTDLQTKTINKLTDSKGQKLIFYNLTTHNVVDVLPAGGFDLMYCRYVSIAKDPNGSTVQLYNVTGVLTGPGVLTAEADGINPGVVSFTDYKEKLNPQTDIIGYDWKTLSGTSWVIDPDKTFFVKTTDNRIWKLHFIDFEGASTGVSVLEKTDLGLFSSVAEWQGVQVSLYPNPATEYVTVALDESVTSDVRISVTDGNGRELQSHVLSGRDGFRVAECQVSALLPGTYFITIAGDGKAVRRSFIKQ